MDSWGFVMLSDRFGYDEDCLDADPCEHRVKIDGEIGLWDVVRLHEYIVANSLAVPAHVASEIDVICKKCQHAKQEGGQLCGKVARWFTDQVQALDKTRGLKIFFACEAHAFDTVKWTAYDQDDE